ncbi:MAG: hypothetical protein IKR81_07395 [Victivallales bacterium]|nr:hypothetical protein [Victivallales bacterium]
MVKIKQTGVVVELQQGEMHPWIIIGRVRRLLREAGYNQEWIDQVLDEAANGDAEYLVDVLMRVVEFKIVE